MNKVSIVKAIVKLYFIGALAGSFTHIITAAGKVGLEGWEMYATPFMIDGLAIIGMIMRTDSFSARTRKIGFRVQLIMGLMSLTANVYAAHNLGGMIFGVGIVALFIFAEWLSDNMEGASADTVNEAEAIVEAAAQRRAAITAKRNATRKKNLRIKAQQAKALEALVNA